MTLEKVYVNYFLLCQYTIQYRFPAQIHNDVHEKNVLSHLKLRLNIIL